MFIQHYTADAPHLKCRFLEENCIVKIILYYFVACIIRTNKLRSLGLWEQVRQRKDVMDDIICGSFHFFLEGEASFCETRQRTFFLDILLHIIWGIALLYHCYYFYDNFSRINHRRNKHTISPEVRCWIAGTGSNWSPHPCISTILLDIINIYFNFFATVLHRSESCCGMFLIWFSIMILCLHLTLSFHPMQHHNSMSMQKITQAELS